MTENRGLPALIPANVFITITLLFIAGIKEEVVWPISISFPRQRFRELPVTIFRDLLLSIITTCFAVKTDVF
jgi:hypothetical protein